MTGRFALLGFVVAVLVSVTWQRTFPLAPAVPSDRTALTTAAGAVAADAPVQDGETGGETPDARAPEQAGESVLGETAADLPAIQPAEAGGILGLFRSLAPVRIPKPEVPAGPRRIGLQAGHWRTSEVPDELRRLEHSTGTRWGAVTEWQLNLDIANRAAAILRGHGYVVDILPTTVPSGYLADVFVAIHADGDTDGSGRGFKAAHGSRRGPYEGHLVRVLLEEYGRATGLPQDSRITRNMLGYYAFSWSRFQSSVAPHTPAAILEMGFLTSAADRALLLQRPDVVATGVANGILRFLDEVPVGAAFANDLIVQPAPFRSPPASVG
jgi:hypothetical protein